MQTSQLILVVAATIAIPLAACSGAKTQPAPKYVSPLGDISVGRTQEEVTSLTQHMRNQIVYKTKEIPASEYEQEVRPSLVYQLRLAGFEESEVDLILDDVDYSRKIQNIR